MKEKVYIASISGGKDSTAMLLELIKRKYPLDRVAFVDLGVEFAPVYEVIRKLKLLCVEQGVEFVTIKPAEDFMYMMLEKPITKRDGTRQIGLKWCGNKCRWATGLKLNNLEKYYKDNFLGCEIVEYVGIACEESNRTKRAVNIHKHTKVYPLIDWGWTEKDCLKYCYSNGYDWRTEEGKLLYGDSFVPGLLVRVSCACCRNKNLWELKNMYKYLPSDWERLRQLQLQMEDYPFYKNQLSIFDLEDRFDKEDRLLESSWSIFDLINKGSQ